MLIEDLNKIWSKIAEVILESMSSRFEVEKKFQIERTFFTE